MISSLRALGAQITDPELNAEWRSLLEESHPALLGRALHHFAQGRERAGETALALEIFHSVAAQASYFGEEQALHARARIEALQGRGSFGDRFELFARNFVQTASDPAALAGMAFAGAAFQSLRLLTYSRLLAAPTASLLTRGFGARGLSWGLAFAAEAPAFTFGTRGVHALLGREQDWSRGALTHELASAYLVLGALKLSGIGGEALHRHLGPSAASAFRPLNFLVRQGSLFTGLVAGHWLEQRAGLLPAQDSGGLLTDALASLVHFNVAARLLRGLGYENRMRRLNLQQRHLESAPPRISGLSGNGWGLSGRLLPALEGNAVFMSASSHPPTSEGPLGSETRGSIHQSPVPREFARLEPRDGLTYVADEFMVMANEARGPNWLQRSLEAARVYGETIEEIRSREENDPDPRREFLFYYDDMNAENSLIRELLAESQRSASPQLDGQSPQVARFVDQYYRSANNFINVLDNIGEIQKPLEFLRSARFWLQNGLEKTHIVSQGPGELPTDFPYQRSEEGYYSVSTPLRSIILIGDEMGARTFELSGLGHEVAHVDLDLSRLKTTKRMVDMRVGRSQSSGQWRFNLEEAAKEAALNFHARVQDAPPADLVEVHFPELFEGELKPRSNEGRVEQLREFLQSNLTSRLKKGGNAFLVSTRDDAVEDLARLVRQNPQLEILDFQQRQNRLPIKAGMNITVEDGDGIFSWLIFRSHGPTPIRR